MPNQENAQLSVSISGDDHVQGGENAAVTLVEYGDYECPHCGTAYEIVEKLKNEMGDRLRFVFRNFPLKQSHEHAEHAAEAAEIASEDGKFWEMHDLLYENQNRLDDESLKSYAEKIGLDAEKFSEDLQSRKFAEKVQKDFMSGVESGVNGTPTFFINGSRHNGSFDYESLLEALQNANG